MVKGQELTNPSWQSRAIYCTWSLCFSSFVALSCRAVDANTGQNFIKTYCTLFSFSVCPCALPCCNIFLYSDSYAITKQVNSVCLAHSHPLLTKHPKHAVNGWVDSQACYGCHHLQPEPTDPDRRCPLCFYIFAKSCSILMWMLLRVFFLFLTNSQISYVCKWKHVNHISSKIESENTQIQN